LHRPRSSAWRRKKKTAQAAEAMGKSRGGLSTKIHVTVDALGNPMRLLLTPGKASEYEQVAALIDGFTCEAVLADKGYDSAAFVNAIQRMGVEAVIPSKGIVCTLAHWIGISTRRAT
jgi:transposase